ncbi:unnamed protein product, partial [Urochloa humidicola]
RRTKLSLIKLRPSTTLNPLPFTRTARRRARAIASSPNHARFVTLNPLWSLDLEESGSRRSAASAHLSPPPPLLAGRGSPGSSSVAMSAAAAASAGFPKWALLELYTFRRDDDDSFPDESEAPIRASGVTTLGDHFRIAFSI